MNASEPSLTSDCTTADQLRQLIAPNDRDFEERLRNLTLAPYIAKARPLISVPGKGGANLFRHSMFALSVLLDYGFTDPVLLKASVIHDLFENPPVPRPCGIEEEVRRIDSDGPAVCTLVEEMTIRTENNVREPKSEYLARVMNSGSLRARVLKLVDRIANVTFLGFVHDRNFVIRCLMETRTAILPHAESISRDMFRELTDLVEDREKKLRLIEPRD